MKTSKKVFRVSQTLVAVAVCAAFGPARAQNVDQLYAPGSSVSAGIGLSSGDEKDRARFGMFNGLRKHDVNGLFGFSYQNRDANSGKWLQIDGRNIGLDNREFGISYRQLGDMKLWGEYSELVRHDPRTFKTGLLGAGSTSPTVVVTPIGGGAEYNPQLKRKSFSLNGEKWFGGTLQAEVNFKSEDKDGARFFGKGFACTSGAAPGCLGPTATNTGYALLMLPEPVDSRIQQLDAKLNYAGTQLNLTGGYYGSWYRNSNGSINPSVPGSLYNFDGTLLPLNTGLQAILNLPMALWPDNEAHQVYLSGNYKFTPSTRVNFKYSYTHATQNESFGGMGLANAPAGRSDLGGVINWTKAQVGFAAHPWSPLHLHGDLKYEHKQNKTPIALYNIEGTGTFTNGAQSPKKLDGKLEANYKLPANFNLVGGVFFENEDFGAFTQTVNVAGLSGLRQKTKETGYRLELRKVMSETLTGSVSFSQADRSGDSPWLKPNSLACQGVATSAAIAGLNGNGVIPADTGLPSVTSPCTAFNNGIAPSSITNKPIFPFMFEDRRQDKLRLMANWMPTERLGLTFFVEDGEDKYTHPSTDHGLRKSSNLMYSVDASFALSEAWKLTAYMSRGDRKLSAGHSTGYDADMRDTADSLGIGVIGKPSDRFRVGADLVYLDDTLKYKQSQDSTCATLVPGCTAANVTSTLANIAFLNTAGGLPDVKYRLLRLKFFGEYAINKASYVRADLIHERTTFNEWTYNYNNTPFFYSDGTTLGAKEKQSVNFLGATYIYKFQ